MNKPALHLVRTREQTIEECLTALTNVMADKSIDLAAREKCAEAHKRLHACRSMQTVARLEREQHIGPNGGDAA